MHNELLLVHPVYCYSPERNLIKKVLSCESIRYSERNHLKLTLNLKSSSAHPGGQSSCRKIHSEKLFFLKASNNEKDFIIFNLSKSRFIPFAKKRFGITVFPQIVSAFE